MRPLGKHIEVVSCDHWCCALILFQMVLEILAEAQAISDATMERVARAFWMVQPSMADIWNTAVRALGTRGAD